MSTTNSFTFTVMLNHSPGSVQPTRNVRVSVCRVSFNCKSSLLIYRTVILRADADARCSGSSKSWHCKHMLGTNDCLVTRRSMAETPISQYLESI
jgi:hypothetical protein